MHRAPPAGRLARQRLPRRGGTGLASCVGLVRPVARPTTTSYARGFPSRSRARQRHPCRGGVGPTGTARHLPFCSLAGNAELLGPVVCSAVIFIVEAPLPPTPRARYTPSFSGSRPTLRVRAVAPLAGAASSTTEHLRLESTAQTRSVAINRMQKTIHGRRKLPSHAERY